MRYGDDPFVVFLDVPATRPDRRIRLADVLVTASDGRYGPERIAAWFGSCPGLTLVLIVHPDRTAELGTRDGVVASLRLDPSVSVRSAAVALYHGWVGQLTANDLRTR